MPKKLKYENVKNNIEEKGWKLLEKEYKTVHTKMKMICPQGHVIEKTFNSFKKGKDCNKCPMNKNNLEKQYKTSKLEHDNFDISFVKKEIEKCGWKLLSKEYKYKEKLLVICPNGHKYERQFNNFRKKQECKICQRHTYEYVKKCFEQKKWKLLSKTYKRSDIKLDVICDRGHEIQKTFDSFNRGHGCSKCNIFINEERTREIFENFFQLKFEKQRPSFLGKLELDGFNKELKIAFEYHGDQHYNYIPTFFHSKGIERFFAQICRDKIKKRLCDENGIKLIIVNKRNINVLKDKILPFITE